ncbi:MAG: hypothetical protein KDH96_08570, partial [Candidatus Riesia sp.]|nr:hypothetical protein [Candidatus Riesia sp.]
SVAKLDALRELRNRIGQIEDTNVAYQRQLAAQRDQAAAPIANILGSFQQVAGQEVPIASLPGAEFSSPGGVAQASGGGSIFGFLNRGRRDENQSLFG